MPEPENPCEHKGEAGACEIYGCGVWYGGEWHCKTEVKAETPQVQRTLLNFVQPLHAEKAERTKTTHEFHYSQDTSLKTYFELKASGEIGERQQQVFEGFQLHGAHTALEISDLIAVPIRTVAARVNELEKLDLLQEIGKRNDQISGRTAIVWAIKNAGQPIEKVVKEYLSKSDLKRRGWTDTAIKLFMGGHDTEMPNPHCKTSPSMKLYRLERIERIEASKEYQEYKDKSKPRLDAAQKSLKTKMGKFMAKVSRMEIYIPRRHYTDITKEAVEAYNRLKTDMLSEQVTNNYTEAEIAGITATHLWHGCYAYHKEIDKMTGAGKKEAHALLNQRIFTQIGETYPKLKAECKAQLEKKIMGAPL